MRKILEFLLTPYYWYKENRLIKKRLEELKQKDPFIYK